MRRLALTVGGVLALSMLGCSESPTPAGMTVRDSAGVHIVEYAGMPAPSHSITVAAEPLYRFGDEEGEYLFENAYVGVLLPDGGAVVADYGSGEVVAIERDGSLRSIVARRGQGPGEVRQVRSLTALGGDTVLVDDRGNARLMYFADTTLVRSVSTMSEASISRGLMARGADAAGHLLMVTSSYNPRFSEPWFQGSLVRLEPEELRADTVAKFDLAMRQPAEDRGNPFSSFGDATTTGGRFVTLRMDRPEVVWRAANGALHQLLRWNPVRTYPTEVLWQEFQAALRVDLARMNPQMGPAEVAQFVDVQLERYEVQPDVPLPLFSQIYGAREGGVWLQEWLSSPSQPISLYTVISPDGQWLGTAELPTGFRLLDVANGRVLGVLRDEMDVQSVAVFEVRMARLGP